MRDERAQFLTTGLDEVLARPAPTEPEQRALALFESVAATVPAYQAFLAEHGVDPAVVRTVDDFSTLPLLTKDNYLRRHPLARLCRGGRLVGCDMVAVSSGSTGEPTFWPRSVADEFAVATRFEQVFHDSFGADRCATLAVVCFALGTWVGELLPAPGGQGLSDHGDHPGKRRRGDLAGGAARLPPVPQGRRRHRPGPRGAVAGLSRQAGASR